jgi:CubicO group peptidase (beta-lactamase class C family)
MNKTLTALLGLTLTLVLTVGAWAQALPTATPEQVGLSSVRLGRITEMVTADVEKGRLPGAVVLIARKGKVAYFQAIGFRDRASRAPMAKDAIFRIYSMTKPFTSVAAMMLVEEGKLQLTDPVSRYLPEMAKLEVGVEKRDASGQPVLERVPAAREMTVQDLLRHTSGLTYGVFGKSAVKELYLKAEIAKGDYTNAGLVEKLSTLPLAHQPGTTWEYSRSTDLLGRVIEVAAGTTLARFFEERIFRSLKMVDSGFSVPAGKHGRIAQPLATDPDTGRPIKLLDVTSPPKFEAGGQGAVATTMDYARFCQMLLNRGQLNGARLLGRKTVEYMTTDHLGDIKFRPGWGFGLGFAVRTADGIAGQAGSVGEYNWGGYGGTYFWVDPREDMFAIWMAQGPGQRDHYRGVFKNLVMQALQ